VDSVPDCSASYPKSSDSSPLCREALRGCYSSLTTLATLESLHCPTGAAAANPRPLDSSPILVGQDHLSAKALVLRTERAEVDAAGATAPSRVLPVPDEVVVARLVLAAGRSYRGLALTVTSDVAFHY